MTGLNFTEEELKDAYVRMGYGEGNEMTDSRPEYVAGPKPNKYRAQVTVYQGRKYPSIHEAEVAEWLDLAVRAGKYDRIQRQVSLDLDGKTDTGRPFRHRIDFAAFKDGAITWFEAKGRDLIHGKMKRRQCEQIYHIKINLV